MTRCADRLEALAQRLREQHGVSARVLIATCPRTVASMPPLRRSRASPSSRCWSTTLVSAVWPVRRDLARTHRPPDRDPLARDDAAHARRPPGHDRSPPVETTAAPRPPAPPSMIRTSSRGPQWPREQAGRRCQTSGGAVKDLVELCKASAGADPESICRSRTMVSEGGFEPPRPIRPLGPQPSASTKFRHSDGRREGFYPTAV